MSYVGRFAPSPTGPLHFGSLVAALASCLEARGRGGHWVVRIEEIDPPREVAGSAELILRTLDAYGFQWDGPVLYQSRRDDIYRAALDTLLHQGHAYACRCSRREAIEAAARVGLAPGGSPRTCRSARHEPRADPAVPAIARGGVEVKCRRRGRQRQALARGGGGSDPPRGREPGVALRGERRLHHGPDSTAIRHSHRLRHDFSKTDDSHLRRIDDGIHRLDPLFA